MYNTAIENLSCKTSKAYFAVRSVLKKVDFDTNISLKIFDTALKPILTYNSEIWSQLNPRQFKALKKFYDLNDRTQFIFDSLLRETETQHLSFCKSILGVNRSCSNIAVMGELGRLPLLVDCLDKQFLYFHRLISLSDESSLIKRAFNESYKLKQNDHYSWVNSCCLLLESFGIQSDPTILKTIKTNKFKYLVKRTLRHSYERYWMNKVKSPMGPSLQ